MKCWQILIKGIKFADKLNVNTQVSEDLDSSSEKETFFGVSCPKAKKSAQHRYTMITIHGQILKQ